MLPGQGTVLDRVREIAEQVAQRTGLELVLVELAHGGSRAALRLTIDRPGGVTLDDCADFSRRVGAELEIEDPIQGAYELEVSSPGLDRRLFKESDYSRFTGRSAKIALREPQNGRRNFQGLIRGLEDGEILLEIEGGQIARLPFMAVDKARLVPEV